MIRQMIRLRKLKETKDAEFKAPEMDEYNFGGINYTSTPVGYEVKGELWEDPEVGGFLTINRTERCGVECGGLFRSSRIVKVKKQGFKTLISTNNSVYLLESI